ncbi:MAG: helix-turn-helix transcriptional regulator [Bacteroidia bacterium]
MNNISAFIRYQRKNLGLTQEELASKAGVGLRFIRELEKGKETLRLDKVTQVLSLFGFNLTPIRENIDAYNIYRNYFNRAVKITLTNKVIKYGIIIKEIKDAHENRINAWKFVPNNNAIAYQKKNNDSLTETIMHSTIKDIEIQS